MNQNTSNFECANEQADIETASEDYAKRFSGLIGKFFLDTQSRITLNLLNEYPNSSILDVGGGHGQLAEPLGKNGFQITVTGSDNLCRVRLDKLLLTDRLTYTTCDHLNLPFEDNYFDIVLSFRLMPHTQHWERLIQEMCRVARSAVILDYPDRRSTNIFYNLLFSLKKRIEGNTRTFHLFSRRELTYAFQQNGFNTPKYVPEFFIPMVIHRKLNSVPISKAIETFCRWTYLTYFFGSPIILFSKKIKKQ